MQRLDKEKARKNLTEILEKMHTDADLAMLSEYKKIYKREVSLFRRSWAAAWLLMYYDSKETPRLVNFQRSSKPKNEGRNREEKKSSPSASTAAVSASAEAEVIIPEDESKRLFISIGKNRRLFPRDIISLISSKTSAAREDVGSIRILDNYSFVQVRDKKADEIIEALNGLRFRGRTLAVNFAKPKASESGEGESEGNNS